MRVSEGSSDTFITLREQWDAGIAAAGFDGYSAYCSNRGGVAGSNVYSSPQPDLAACARYVKETPECGTDFSYSEGEYCDCVPHGSACLFTNYSPRRRIYAYRLGARGTLRRRQCAWSRT